MQTVTVKRFLGDWNPAVKVDHDGFETGYYVRHLLINGQSYLSIKRLGDNPPMPHHVDITKDKIHRWTYECAYGFVLFVSDVCSNSGLHYVKMPDGLYCKWRLVNVLDPPAYARDGAKVLLDEFIKKEGFQAVEWYVGGGSLDRAWILQKVADGSPHFEINIEGDPQPSTNQGWLSVTPICVDDSDIELFNSPASVSVYGHEFKSDFFIRWFDKEQNKTNVVAHIVSAINARDHDDLNIESGWYLLSHPRPSRSVD